MGKGPTLVAIILLTLGAAAQNQTPDHPNDMPGMNISQVQSMPDMPGMGGGGAAAMHAMEGHHMDMGPHMKTTALRPLHPGDRQRAVEVAVAARAVAEDVIQPGPKFGLNGSITTKAECDAAGGRFFPQVFGWMVHVYPFEQKPEDIWSVERQHNHMD